MLDIPEAKYSRSLILVFGTFLLASLLGLAAGHLESFIGPLASPASGIVGLFLGLILAGFWLFRHFRRTDNDRLFPVITAIIAKGGHHV